MSNIHYFAYGSDMSLRQMQQRLLDAEIFLDDECRHAATLSGYRLTFNKGVATHPAIGFANVEVEANSVVEGVLYSIPAKALPILDAHEGVAEEQYRRIECTVNCPELGGAQKAQMYIANAEFVMQGLKPSRNHLYRLLAAERMLSPEYFARLKATESLKVPVDENGIPHGPDRSQERKAFTPPPSKSEKSK